MGRENGTRDVGRGKKILSLVTCHLSLDDQGTWDVGRGKKILSLVTFHLSLVTSH